jgi:hypothetical protein
MILKRIFDDLIRPSFKLLSFTAMLKKDFFENKQYMNGMRKLEKVLLC